MRLLLLSSLLLLPQALLAQLFSGQLPQKFEGGSYVLRENRTIRYTANLALGDEKTLLIKEDGQKKQQLSMDDVLSFEINGRQFKPVANFHIKDQIGGTDIGNSFAELLDSGQVMLLQYHYIVASSHGPYWEKAILLKKPTEDKTTIIYANSTSGGGKKFREAVAPFLTSRPDLLQYLEARRLHIWNLKDAIVALNKGVRFFPAPPDANPN